ncbi:hypothetical protein [Actinacidiphila bryophytorum]|uniref:Uncharacterized protein n=1 Tax=Actinacidiphila bryophytorum TaxID=1436133 RepID=A0A9W4H120_9ACTN|nr:hypothetical protein [Actinacidiphila bryophytorum]MBM9439935.1 hypothetical protein [Actinacidiphila bryophytorum]MBN6546239.1 hypothetical protein [Actinacidiphila bryophytorum]CAG7640600.1 hypothetical protein SBRY_30446 [Actinacidiphila bryophytorum]
MRGIGSADCDCWQACLDLARSHLLPQRIQECVAWLAALEDARAGTDGPGPAP